MKNEKIINVIISIYVLVFVYAAVSKLQDYQNFVSQLNRSSILTDYAKILAWLVPVSELIISVLLIIPLTRLFGLYGGFMLMAMFAVYIVVITRLTDNAPCSCGGILEKMTWNQHLVFNLVLLVIGGYAVFIFPVKMQDKVSRY